MKVKINLVPSDIVWQDGKITIEITKASTRFLEKVQAAVTKVISEEEKTV
jgi:hypothetical protein